jgi:hypothetical protein
MLKKIVFLFIAFVICSLSVLFFTFFFAQRRSIYKEMITKQNLKMLQEAIQEYKRDWGIYPKSLTKVTPFEYRGKVYPPFSDYVLSIPPASLRFGIQNRQEKKVVRWFDNSGGWVYNPENGQIRINKWAFDTKGKIYYLW